MALSFNIEINMLEAGLNHILGRRIEKVDQTVLTEALYLLATKLGTEESTQGHLLVTGIISALEDPDSPWKLTLTHRGKGEALSVHEQARRFARDATITLYVEHLIKDGLTKESACVAAESEFGIKLATVKAMVKRVKKRVS